MTTCRFISHQEITDADFPLQDVYDLVLEGFRLHGLGQSENPPKQAVHTRPRAFMHAMPAYLPTKDIAGTKLVSVYPDNPEKGLDSTTGIVVMMDPGSGITTAIVDARWLTNTRTAMVSIVTAKLLAKSNPVFGIVGATGASGRAHIEAICEFYPGSRVLVNSRNEQRCTELIEAYRERDTSPILRMDQEAVVKECDVLVVCTSRLPQPIFKSEWLHAGQIVLNVHTQGWPSDITDHVDRVSCDDRRQVMDPLNGLIGTYPRLNPDFELGEVVAGTHPGRESWDHTIFCVNYGLAVFDILVADYILSRI